VIRRAVSSDYSTMDEIFISSAKVLCTPFYDVNTIKEWTGKPWPARFAKSEGEGNQQYVVFSESKLVGFGAINVQNKQLVSLFVEPESAGHGFGQQILDFLLDVAREAGLDELHLDASLNAVGFYAKNGFVELGRGSFETQNGTMLESVQMKLPLK